jgi:hypothetical protein
MSHVSAHGSDVGRQVFLLCDDDLSAARIRGLIEGSDIELVRWDPGGSDDLVEAVLVVVGSLAEVVRFLESRLGSISDRARHLILVTPLTPEALRRLGPLARAASMVWWEELEDRLPEALSDALQHRVLDDAWLALSSCSDNPLVLAALKRVLLDDPPRTSVNALATALRVADSTLRYHWDGSFPNLAIRELVDWVVLLRAVEKRGQAGWIRVAHLYGVHLRTLQRRCQRLTGITLSSVAGEPHCLRSAFERWLDLQVEDKEG